MEEEDNNVDKEEQIDDRFNLSRKIFVGNISYRFYKDLTVALNATEEQLTLDGRLMRVLCAEESSRVKHKEGTVWDSPSLADNVEKLVISDDFADHNDKETSECLTDTKLCSVLVRCGVYLRTLDMSASPRLLTDMSMDVIAEHCPNLEVVDLSGMSITDISLRTLAQKCIKLKHRFEKFEKQIEKIAVIQCTVNTLAHRVDDIENNLEYVMNRSTEMERSVENMGHLMHKVVDRCKENISNITNLKTAELQHKDDVIELKWRSMKTNLIFTGIQFHKEKENTEETLNSFIKQKLNIDKKINFVTVHRFGKRGRRGNCQILAKFISTKDKEIVLKNGYKLKGTHLSARTISK
ncbi:unnamed protein product [Mytilus edulis]|uniref:RRM domain-containing protein n=1 Tax=Mytilus edulis TaxID=6550 RepID=A0A8S3QWU5_MYTED|nr:unnamed protein product [Mytilus edulis]